MSAAMTVRLVRDCARSVGGKIAHVDAANDVMS
jgi:hypothetical protein